MTRDYLNLPVDRIDWVCIALNCEFGKSIRLLQLMGFIEHVNSLSTEYGFRQGLYSKKTHQSRTTIRDDLALLSKLGWVNVLTDDRGTDVEILGIPFDSDPRTQGVRPEGVRPPGQRESVPPDSGSPTNKKSLKNSSNEEKKEAPSTLKKDLILKWNEWKPKEWTELKSISPSRDRSIRALGGYREVIDLIPAFMAGAKANKFWISKDISFENVIGTGTTPKGHFHELAERGSSSNLNTTPGTLSQPTKRPEHPDFFPPIDPRIALRPKVNDFKDDADRDRREAEAWEFYRQQQEAA